MPEPQAPPPIDYLLVGHVTKDLAPEGHALGGTVAYSGLTASALGMRVGIVTSAASDLPLGELGAIPVRVLDAERSTTFENRYTAHGREQVILGRARALSAVDVPAEWRRSARVVHLAPIANEVEADTVGACGEGLLCLTPQGWLRRWDDSGRIRLLPWTELAPFLERAHAVIVSLPDLGGDRDAARRMAERCRLLAMTEGPRGATVYWKGEARHFDAPAVHEVDSTGAGDVFAAGFFCRYAQTGDPWSAARLANELASRSVTRRGLDGVPSREEVASLAGAGAAEAPRRPG